MNCSHCRGFVDEFLENASSITKAIGFEMLSGFGEAAFNTFRACITNGATQLFANLAGQIDRCGVSPTR